MNPRRNRWLVLVITTAFAVGLWLLAASRGDGWETIWLPAAVAGAAWPRGDRAPLAKCLRRARPRA